MNRTAAIIGGGLIGGGWAARFLLKGWDVRIYDPDPESDRKIGEVLHNARHALPQLYDAPLPAEGSLTFCRSVSETVVGAEWIQESVPERLDAKHAAYREIQTHCSAGTPIGSSTSGFKPSDLQRDAMRPQDILVAHPFNPVYLLPLVELVPSAANDSDFVEAAKTLLTGIGMAPLHIRKEIDAHIADRLMEAVWREALWLVNDDVATTCEVDEAIRLGFGLRWAQMGLFETFRTAGGEAGMKHFIAQFGPYLDWPWSRLADVPEMTDALVDKIATQSDEQSGALTIRELERLRDDNLVGLLRALKDRDSGVGAHLNAHQKSLGSALLDATHATGSLLRLLDLKVLPSWIDYNGHMTEFRYLQVFADTSDALLRLIGLDMDYVASGYSYYTVESHIMHHGECKLGDRLHTTTQILHADDKRLHVFHMLLNAEDQTIATAEHMMLHVDSKTNRACPARPQIRERLDPLAHSHRDLPRHQVVGRYTGQRRA